MFEDSVLHSYILANPLYCNCNCNLNNLSNTLHHLTATKSQCTHIYHFLTDGTLSESLLILQLPDDGNNRQPKHVGAQN